MQHQTITLTCLECGHKNLRGLPYSMVAPDSCDDCGNWFRTRTGQIYRRYRQSKLASGVEAVVNTLVGLSIAFVAQKAICWAYDIQLSTRDNAIIVFWMTIISVLRSYAVRRIWNSEFWRRK